MDQTYQRPIHLASTQTFMLPPYTVGTPPAMKISGHGLYFHGKPVVNTMRKSTIRLCRLPLPELGNSQVYLICKAAGIPAYRSTSGVRLVSGESGTADQMKREIPQWFQIMWQTRRVTDNFTKTALTGYNYKQDKISHELECSIQVLHFRYRGVCMIHN